MLHEATSDGEFSVSVFFLPPFGKEGRRDSCNRVWESRDV